MADRHSRLYRIWHNMKDRCYNPKNHKYQYYGGKGIVMCDEWKSSYSAFKNWANRSGYLDDLTIDRIDSSMGYCPENCRWVTLKTQANNRVSNRIISLHGVSHTVAEWAEQLNISPNTLYSRLRNGMSEERALTLPIHTEYRDHPLSYNGVTRSLAEWSRATGLTESCIRQRIKRGWSVERTLTTPNGGASR